VKYLIFLLVLIPFQTNAFFYEQEDKNLHVGTSLALTFVFTSTLLLTYPKMSSRKAALLGAATTLLLGLAKESFYDDKFDWEDMGANAIGASMGTIPFIVVDF
jgi:glycopeptide antibiotics resistance protein